MEAIPENAVPIGYQALVIQHKLLVMPHFRQSFIIERGARRELAGHIPAVYLYDRGYALDNNDAPFEHLTFALKHEGLNLEIIAALFAHLKHDAVQAFVAQQPTGKYQRMVWYLYEKLTARTIDITDLESGAYIDLLDPDMYYTAKPIAQRRYRINDNLLGTMQFCPFVRKTKQLREFEQKKLDATARDLVANYTSRNLERASNYLYAKETMSSYQIERERPNKQRLTRFIELIKKSEFIPILTKEILVELQNNVVEARFVNENYRTTQNYIGQSHDWNNQTIHFISPSPKDVDDLMTGLLRCLEKMLESNTNPVVSAAAIAFGFVFIHPFDDGNGRLHRFLIHFILHKIGFTPQGMIFPASATILKDMQHYTDALESFSKPLMKLITEYTINDDGKLSVDQETAQFYRYIDFTTQAEFLALCIETTIQTILKNELLYLTRYDEAKKAIQDIVDMPDQLINLFILLTTQNKGILSPHKRSTHFAMLSDEEVKKMGALIKKIMFSDE